MHNLTLLSFFSLFIIVPGGLCNTRPAPRPFTPDDDCDNSNPALQLAISSLQSQLNDCTSELYITQATAAIQQGLLSELLGRLYAKDEECEQRINERVSELTAAVQNANVSLGNAYGVINGRDCQIATLEDLLNQASTASIDSSSNSGDNNLSSFRQSIQIISDSIALASELLDGLLRKLPMDIEPVSKIGSGIQEAPEGETGTRTQVQKLMDAIELAGFEVAKLEKAAGNASN